MIHPIIELKKTESTNDYLEELLVGEDLAEGTVVMSLYQTKGKGMLQNLWQSDAGKNLLFSLLLKPAELKVHEQFFLSKAISLAVHDMLTDILKPGSVLIKWPNDIIVSSRKISGILIKCNLRNTSVQQAIIGIGLNLNQTSFPEMISATSILAETGRESVIDEMLKELLIRIDYRFMELNSKKFEKIDRDYHQQLFGYGLWMEFSGSGKIFQGKIIEVGADGRLKLEKRDGKVESYEVKEISLNSTRPIS